MPERKGEAEPTEEGWEERGGPTPLRWSGRQGGPHGGGEARAHLKGGSPLDPRAPIITRTRPEGDTEVRKWDAGFRNSRRTVSNLLQRREGEHAGWARR